VVTVQEARNVRNLWPGTKDTCRSKSSIRMPTQRKADLCKASRAQASLRQSKQKEIITVFFKFKPLRQSEGRQDKYESLWKGRHSKRRRYLETNTNNSMPPHLQQAGCLARLPVQLHPQGQQDPPSLRRRQGFHPGWSFAVRGPHLPPRRSPAGWGLHSAFLRDTTHRVCLLHVGFHTFSNHPVIFVWCLCFPLYYVL
jgi:hypothetical protein